jgi:hypothetical protein
MGKVIGGSTGKSHQRIFHQQTERAEQFRVFGIVCGQRMPFGKRHCAASKLSSHGKVWRMDFRNVKTRFHSSRQLVSIGLIASTKSISV